MPDNFKGTVDRVLQTAGKWFSIYIRIIFALVAIGIGYTVFMDVFFPPSAEEVEKIKRDASEMFPARRNQPATHSVLEPD